MGGSEVGSRSWVRGWALTCTLPLPGLIIDAFGELRDQQEQVKEDMEVGHGRERPRRIMGPWRVEQASTCLLYTSDAADDPRVV